MNKTLTFTTTDSELGTRLDRFLTSALPELTRSAVKALIDAGHVSINEKTASKAGVKLHTGECVTIEIEEKPAEELLPVDIPLDILYEDAEIIVVNKAAGTVVHPGAGNSTGTLAAALMGHTKKLSNLEGPLRPGIVHRIDKDTTGVMVAAKTNEAHENLKRQFKLHTTDRRYLAIVWGDVNEESGKIDAPIGRSERDRKKISTSTRKPRDAVTHYRVLERFGYFSLLTVTLETGRTHQVRVHLASINHPVVS
ncbi:MAG: RluA family pseudouridine synthase, partial [Thermodesulfobacteriota bacterium]